MVHEKLTFSYFFTGPVICEEKANTIKRHIYVNYDMLTVTYYDLDFL